MDVPALLARAVATRRLGAVRLLVAGGADVNAVDAHGWTPLIEAASHGMVEALLRAGAQVNTKTPTGWTALTAAVAKRNMSAVRQLLAAGADVHVRDHAGETPILIASKVQALPGGVVPAIPAPHPASAPPQPPGVGQGTPPRPHPMRAWRTA